MKAGYKQSEVGVIPEDWDDVPLNSICQLINGRGFKPHEWGRFGYPIIRIQNLNGSDDFNYFSGRFDPKLLVDNGQLLFAWSGSRGTSFGPHIWRGQTAVLNYHTWKVVTLERKVDDQFLFHALRQLTKSIEDSAHGASALVHTQKREMENYRVPSPRELSEQRSIAAVLYDSDALIASLDTLIAKKRDLKDATMQQLLTGKTRLPGFREEWKKVTLGDLGDFSKGRGIRRDQVKVDGLACVRYGEIYTHHRDILREYNSFIDQVVARESQRLQRGDLLFAGSGETAEEIGKCVAFISTDEAYAGGDIVIFTPRIDNSAFLGYLMNHSSIVKQKSRMGQGDAVVHISAKNLARIAFDLPAPQEQEAIANVLIDMDDDLFGLEAKRDKALSIKQGMMQELLTGKIRLL